jgi:hypothetical protein
MIRGAALSTAVAAALVVAACGSSSSNKNAGTTTGAAGSQNPPGQTVPPIQGKGGSGAKAGSTTAGKPPPVPANGETIKAGNFFAFKAPSGQLGCAYTKDPTTLRCDVSFPTRLSRSGHKCQQGDYGHSFEVSPNGHASAICAGDTVLSANGARTIPYGHAWTIGPYACTSQATSLTCTNGQGHGFRLSRGQQLIF